MGDTSTAQSPWKLLGFCRTGDEFGLIFLILNMIEVYWRDVCCVGHSPQTSDYCGDWLLGTRPWYLHCSESQSYTKPLIWSKPSVNQAVITVPAYGPAPNGARPSAGTVLMTTEHILPSKFLWIPMILHEFCQPACITWNSQWDITTSHCSLRINTWAGIFRQKHQRRRPTSFATSSSTPPSCLHPTCWTWWYKGTEIT